MWKVLQANLCKAFKKKKLFLKREWLLLYKVDCVIRQNVYTGIRKWDQVTRQPTNTHESDAVRTPLNLTATKLITSVVELNLYTRRKWLM